MGSYVLPDSVREDHTRDVHMRSSDVDIECGGLGVRVTSSVKINMQHVSCTPCKAHVGSPNFRDPRLQLLPPACMQIDHARRPPHLHASPSTAPRPPALPGPHARDVLPPHALPEVPILPGGARAPVQGPASSTQAQQHQQPVRRLSPLQNSLCMQFFLRC
jgi:hypothetical protein